MTWLKPSPRVVWKAVQTYLAAAYDGPPAGPLSVPDATPSAVRARLETLRSTPDESFYDSPVFERGPGAGPASVPSAPAAARDAAPLKEGAGPREPKAEPSRFALRLGNRSYPHMKLIIDRAPDGRSYLLRADTHDAHVSPKPGSREYAAFQQLSLANRAVADAIESAWEAQGLPTFKSFLRDDLERRKAAAGAGA